MTVPPEMIQALYTAGFRGAALQRMAAIGMRESGGNPTAHNGNAATGDDSWGWFQINYLGNLRASRTAQFGTPQQLISSPQAQANAAWALYNQAGGFGPWTTNKGLAPQFLADAQAGIDQLTSAGTIAQAPTGFSGTQAAPQTGGNPGATTSNVPFNPANVDQIIRQSYGYEAWALDIPELHAALSQALSDHGTAIDQATLQGYITATNWWKTNSTAQRNFAQLNGEDPAQAAAQLSASQTNVNDLIAKFGLNVDPARAAQMAKDAVTNGWNSQQLNQAMMAEAQRHVGGDATQSSQPALPNLPPGEVFVDEVASPFGGSYGLTNKGGVYTLNGARFYGSYLGYAATTPNPVAERAKYGTFAKGGLTVNPDGTYTLHNTAGNPYYFGPGVPGGVAGATLPAPLGSQVIGANGAFSGGELASNYATVQAMARAYYMNIDPAAAQKMAIQLTGGEITPSAMQGTITQQALAKYAGDPTTLAGINAGFTLKQLATDQLNSMSKLLGVSADSIDLSSPKWSQVLNYRDPTTGATRMMNTGETENLVRKSPDWLSSSDGNSTTASALKAFTTDMGQSKF